MHSWNRFLQLGSAVLLVNAVTYAAETPPAPAPMQHGAGHNMKALTDEDLIASAMKAAPADVAKNATIVAPGADGKTRTLRQGTNAFTCMPDNPETPGPDPMCWDKNADGWIDAYLGHKTPPTGKVGMMYMLAGGTDASNTDPYAAKPSANNHWIKTGPHIMIVGADAAFYDSYPKDADPNTKSPYVMWAGTPYQHLMAPIR